MANLALSAAVGAAQFAMASSAAKTEEAYAKRQAEVDATAAGQDVARGQREGHAAAVMGELARSRAISQQGASGLSPGGRAMDQFSLNLAHARETRQSAIAAEQDTIKMNKELGISAAKAGRKSAVIGAAGNALTNFMQEYNQAPPMQYSTRRGSGGSISFAGIWPGFKNLFNL